MKRTAQRRGGTTGRTPREIRVRRAAPRPVDGPPDVWVVNGRVIRFLDPMRGEEVAPDHHAGLRALLGRLHHRHAGS